MTDIELIAQARELCEKRISFYEHEYEIEPNDLKHEELNSWTTHLAEMDELELLIAPIDVCVHNYGCAELEWAYSAESELLTKAKRLLGVE